MTTDPNITENSSLDPSFAGRSGHSDKPSLWLSEASMARPPGASLGGDVETEVLVVGAGITGLTLALLLAQRGTPFILVEAGDIGGGTSGHSTGNLYEVLSDTEQLHKHWGAEVARQVLEQRRAAVGWIARSADEMRIDCGLRECTLHLWGEDADAMEAVDKEREAWIACGLQPAVGEWEAGLGMDGRKAASLHGQAQFQVVDWLRGLAFRIAERGGRIVTQTRVTDIDFKERRAQTAGGSIRAREIVLATHSPLGIHPVHAEMPVHREYAAAWAVSRPVPPGIFWSPGSAAASVRGAEIGGQHYLVCVGEECKTGGHDASQALRALCDGARARFGLGEPRFSWSAQNYRGADGLPYIGRDLRGCHIATGFATDGLVWGTAAAHAIADGLAGRDHPLLALCRPGRLSPVKGAGNMLDALGTTAKSLVRDYLTHPEHEALSSLPPGEGAVVEIDGKAHAAYRSREGKLTALSPVCTHMGCRVHWNAVETSWDCPCHGSRFSIDGTVIEGPAIAPLARRDPP